jgi:hypothetical protein
LKLFYVLNLLSNRTMALGSTQPPTEMSTRNFPGGNARLVRKAYNPTAICEPIVHEMWSPPQPVYSSIRIFLIVSHLRGRSNSGVF